jgi:hypothetical protein
MFEVRGLKLEVEITLNFELQTSNPEQNIK